MGAFEIGVTAGTVALLALVGIAWRVRLNDFSIRGGKGKTAMFSGNFPGIYRTPMKQFLENEIEEEDWVIKGAFKDRRFIRLTFSRNMHAFTKQRIRNFLMSLLHP